MKRLFKTVCVFLSLSLAFIFAAGCSTGGMGGKRVDIKPDRFGTVSTVAAYAEESELLAAAEEIEAVFEEIDNAVSLSSDGSDISAFNKASGGETLEISRITYGLLKSALEAYEYTDGAYNPAVGRLVDLWGLSSRFTENDYAPALPYDRDPETVPAEEYVSAFRTLTDFGKVTISENGGKYYVTKPDSFAEVNGVIYYMMIDLGGIAKGRAADLAADILSRRGITQSYVSVGTSSLFLLDSKKDGWTVTLRHPRYNEHGTVYNYATVYAKNTAASTSGDYERYFTADGKRYCHIIDPTSGAPIDNGMATVSLFGRSAEEGDALTTALEVMGKDKAIAFINDKLTDCRVCMVWYNADEDRYEFITNMEGGYELHDKNIEVHSTAKDGKITYVA